MVIYAVGIYFCRIAVIVYNTIYHVIKSLYCITLLYSNYLVFKLFYIKQNLKELFLYIK